jgi:hypothetical protein
MQFAIGVTILECSFVKHSHGPLGVKSIKLHLSQLYNKREQVAWYPNVGYEPFYDTFMLMQLRFHPSVNVAKAQ